MLASTFCAPDTPSSESSSDSFDPAEGHHDARPPHSIAKPCSHQLISSQRPPFPRSISVCLVDPFYTLPIEVDNTTNQLLHFYGQDTYFATAYALSPKIELSIKGSWEYQAGSCLTHLHILMARSALHQLRMNREWGTRDARRELEYAALKHQTQAITILRENVSKGPNADLKVILTSVVSLATFEQRYGDRHRAVLHFKNGRDIIRQIGVEDAVLNDRLIEEQALWFEGIYRDHQASWMWGQEDANMRLGWLKTLLKDIDRMWRDRKLLPLTGQGYLQGRLREFLFRETRGRSVSIYGDIDEFVAQQRCVLIIVSVMCGVNDELSGVDALKTSSRAMELNVAIRKYTDFIENLLAEYSLGENEAVADLLWMMCQNYRDMRSHLVLAASPSSEEALNSLDLKDCHWRASGIANVMKYLPQSRQLNLRDMLLDFIDGKPYTGKVRVNEFEFSYADM